MESKQGSFNCVEGGQVGEPCPEYVPKVEGHICCQQFIVYVLGVPAELGIAGTNGCSGTNAVGCIAGCIGIAGEPTVAGTIQFGSTSVVPVGQVCELNPVYVEIVEGQLLSQQFILYVHGQG